MSPVDRIDELPYEPTNRVLQKSGDDPHSNGIFELRPSLYICA